MAKSKPPAWLESLGLRERLLIWISGAQSRYETAIVDHLGQGWPARLIRDELRKLAHEKCIHLENDERVRWRIGTRGLNQAATVRAAAKAKAAA